MNLGILDYANKFIYEKSIHFFTNHFFIFCKRPTERLCLDRKQLYQKGIHGAHA